MKSKILLLTAVAVSLSFTLAGCQNQSASGDDKIVLKAGFSTGDKDPRVIATELFKNEIEQATDGRITVEIHPDGELGSDADLISGVMNGDVDITASSAGNFANYSSDVGISALPFLFSDFDEAWKFVDGDIESMAEEGLEDYNIKVLAHYDNGFRCVTTSAAAGPVDSVADMENLVIRTPENQIVMETMLALGAQPKVLEFTKLYDALKDGSFDAQENPIPVIYNNKLNDVQANLAVTNHSYDVMPFVIRKDVWDKLSEADQQLIMDAAAKAQERDRTLIKSQTEDYVKKLKEAGMTITYPDLSEFKSATTSVYDSLASHYDSKLMEMIKQ